MRKTHLLAAVAASIGLAGSLFGVAGAASAATTAGEGGSYVALGDSFAAGTGAGNYIAASGACYQSTSAYPAVWAANHPTVKSVSYACSGATTSTVLGDASSAPAIAAALATATKVSLTVGGNEVGWNAAAAICLTSTATACRAYLTTTVKPVIEQQLPAKLDALFARVKQLAPFAKVEVVGYPRLFDADGACLWTVGQRTVMNEYADLMINTIRDRAETAELSFVDTRAAAAGHGVCSANPWIRNVGDGATFEWLHPTAAYHAAVAALLNAPATPLAKINIAGTTLSVAVRKDLQRSKQRVVIWVNGKYVAETWSGSSYYSWVTDSAEAINVLPGGVELKRGDRVQVAIVSGEPGGAYPDPNTVPRLADTTVS